MTRLSPNRSEAWRKLDCQYYNGKWLSRERIEAAKAEANEQYRADLRWQPYLESLKRSRYGPESERVQWMKKVAGVTDPRAVPTICASSPRAMSSPLSRKWRFTCSARSTRRLRVSVLPF